MTIVIPAKAGFEILYLDIDDAGYIAVPIVAWAIDDDTIADDPQPIGVTGIHTGSDAAIRYPNQTILYDGSHYSDLNNWLFAARARQRTG